MSDGYPLNAWLTQGEASSRWGNQPITGRVHRCNYVRADLHEALAARVVALEAALRPFADIGIGSDPDYQPLVRMDRDAIVKARAALWFLHRQAANDGETA